MHAGALGVGVVVLCALCAIGGTLFMELFVPPGDGVSGVSLRAASAETLLRRVHRTRDDLLAQARSERAFTSIAQRLVSEFDRGVVSAPWLLGSGATAGTRSGGAKSHTRRSKRYDLDKALDAPFAVRGGAPTGEHASVLGNETEVEEDEKNADLRAFSDALDLNDAFYANASRRSTYS